MDDMVMDDGTSSEMTMTFTSWSVYKLQILFESWNVDTKWEFALSWIAVLVFAIIYHAMRFLIYTVEDFMDPNPRINPLTSEQYRKGYQATNDDEEEKLDSSSGNNKIAILSPWRYFWFRVLHSILTGLTYGLALLLMLIAMTYNPSLFMALIIGYAFGDFIFFAQMRPSSFSECH